MGKYQYRCELDVKMPHKSCTSQSLMYLCRARFRNKRCHFIARRPCTVALPALLHLNVPPSGASDWVGSPPIVKLLIIPLPVCYKEALGLAPPTNLTTPSFLPILLPWLPVISYAAYPCALAPYSLVRPNWRGSGCWPPGVGIPSTACVRSQISRTFPSPEAGGIFFCLGQAVVSQTI
jgi:hypothetical protein